MHSNDAPQCEGHHLFFLQRHVDSYSQTRTLDESLDQSGDDHFASAATV